MKKFEKSCHILPSREDIRSKDDLKEAEHAMEQTKTPLERGGMTNLERLAEIERLFETQDEESLDADRIAALLGKLEAEAPAPPMKLNIESAPVQRPRRRLSRPFVRAAVSVAAVIAICFAITTPALGENGITVFFDKNSEHMYIDSENLDRQNAPARALRDALDEVYTGYVPLPWWIPEKYTLDHYEVIDLDGLRGLDAYFASGDIYFEVYIYIYDPDMVWGASFEKDIGGEEKEFENTTCYLFTNAGTPVATWLYNNTDVMMTGNLPLEELDAITDSIK